MSRSRTRAEGSRARRRASQYVALAARFRLEAGARRTSHRLGPEPRASRASLPLACAAARAACAPAQDPPGRAAEAPGSGAALRRPGQAAEPAPRGADQGGARARARRQGREHRDAHVDLRRARATTSTKLGYLRAGAVVDRSEASGRHRRLRRRLVPRRAARLRLRRQGRVARARPPGRRRRPFRGPARHEPLPYQYVTSQLAAAAPLLPPPDAQGPGARRGRHARRAPRARERGAEFAKSPLDPVPDLPRRGPRPAEALRRRGEAPLLGARRPRARRPRSSASSRRSSGRAAASASRPSSTSSRSTAPSRPPEHVPRHRRRARGHAGVRDPPGRAQAARSTRSATLHEDGTAAVPLRLGAHRQEPGARCARRPRGCGSPPTISSSPTPHDDPPGFAADGKKWIDVSIRKQLLVAYEGRRAGVRDARVDRHRRDGRPRDDARDRARRLLHPREARLRRRWTATRPTDTYDLRDVPYIQYFHEGYALHGAFWHDDFGHAAQPRLRQPRPGRRGVALRVDRPGRAARWHGAVNAEGGTLVCTHG